MQCGGITHWDTKSCFSLKLLFLLQPLSSKRTMSMGLFCSMSPNIFFLTLFSKKCKFLKGIMLWGWWERSWPDLERVRSLPPTPPCLRGASAEISVIRLSQDEHGRLPQGERTAETNSISVGTIMDRTDHVPHDLGTFNPLEGRKRSTIITNTGFPTRK